ncbi:MAG: insulinase family protein [Bacteroidales bacterium]|nr:insulinase family protein [Bacteroidales bacterium]
MKRIFVLLAAIITATSMFGQSQLPNDPEVRKGQLENGLTYYIRHNDKPAGRAEFYLATNVGAIQETPDQDGLAHFLEHMCFNGTQNLPGKQMLEYLQKIGAEFGRNINAQTGVEQTTYMLNNIPVTREGIIDTCILIMHDYSHFVTCDPIEIDKERGVIIEEKRSRNTASWRMFEKSLPYYYGDSKYATCTLIGSQENLETFKPESLTNFYHTWYRPDLQAVIVVGDIDVDQIEAKIRDRFSDIPAAVNPKAKEMHKIPDNDEPIIGIITDPEATNTELTIFWKSEPTPEELNSTDYGFFLNLLNDYIYLIMSERLNDITSRPGATFIRASL